MKFACPHCDQLMEVDTIYSGQEVGCPGCGETVAIPEVRSQESGVRGQGSAAGDQRSEVRNQEAGVSGRGPEAGDQRSEVRSQESGVGRDEQSTGNIQHPTTDQEDPQTVKALWAETIQAAAPEARDDVTMTLKGQTMPGTGTSARTMPDTVKVRPKEIAQQGESATIPEYEIMRMLGEGGMGMVYEARQTSIDRSIAVKMIKPEVAGEENCRQFLAEAVATADLDHPNIVPIHDLGMNSEGALFYAMKQVKGTSWKDLLPNESASENLAILIRVADAVAFAHSRGVIHRDLKPENVMLGDFGEVLLMDWGLAAAMTEDAKADPLDPDHAIGGTPCYMAPEMATGDASKIGYGSDIYLLGAMLFEIVTGQRPHTGAGAMDCLANAAANQIVEVDESGELFDIALTAMATEPGDRYESVKAFQAAVRDYKQHEESILLSANAGESLAQAKKTQSYNNFVDAVAGFKQALALWDGNATAAEQLTCTSLAYAECAFKKHDYELAESLLDKNTKSHSELLAQVTSARKERDARQKRMKALKIISAVSAAAVVLILSVAAVWINGARKQAEDQRNIAEGALNSLRGTAPTFYKLAQEMVSERQFAEALTNINYAISLVPDNASYHHQKGNILQSLLDLKSALAAYETVIKFDPDFPHARENVELSKAILEISGSSNELPPASIGQLYAAMQAQNRLPEALALSRLLSSQAASLRPVLEKTLTDAGFGANNPRGQNYNLRIGPDGTVRLELSRADDISAIQGMPITELTLTGDVSDLSPLKGMPLKVLDARGCRKIRDLSPLKGMKLTKLVIGITNWETPIEDLSPLEGMPLKSLALARAPVSDLSPLQGMPLEELDLAGCFSIADLSPLAGLPLKSFAMKSYYNANTSSQISDISPLRGVPLRSVDLTACNRIRDLSPMAESPLEKLDFLPEEVATGFDEIRNCKSLKMINGRPAEQFWEDFDKGKYYGAGEFKEQVLAAWPGAQIEAGEGKTVTLKIAGRKDVKDLMPLKGVPVSSLTAYACSNLRDLSGLEGAPLKWLSLSFNKKQIRDITPLKGLPLVTLDLSDTAVSDLTPLKGAPIEDLQLKSTYVSNLSPLAGMPIKKLSLFGCNKVTDLSPLKGMPLTSIDLQGVRAKDISPLAGAPLPSLSLSGDCIDDLSSLSNMPSLTSLDISLSKVTDIGPLTGIPLTDLRIYKMRINNISALRGMPLKSLNIEACGEITDLSPLQGAPLESLSITATRVNDLSPLKGMSLTSLKMGGIPATDLSPLKGMPLTELDLLHKGWTRTTPTAATDLTPLAGLPLASLVFSPDRSYMGMDAIRNSKTLKTINRLPAATFWKKYDAGEFKK